MTRDSSGIRRRVALLALAAQGVLAPAVLAQGREPIRIGVVTDLSATFAPLGEQGVNAIKFAAEEANKAGGVGGRQVQVRILDSEGKPDVARRQAEKLVSDGYRLLTGLVSSGETLAIAPLLDRWNAVYVTTMAKADAITGADCKSRLFRVNMSNSMDSATIKSWLSTRPEKKWSIIATDITFARGSAELFSKLVKDNGGTVTSEHYPPANTSDYAPFIQQIKASDAQGVWVVVGGRDAITFAQQASQFGLTKAKTMGGVSFIADSEAKQLGEVVKGIYGIVNYSAAIDTPENKAFVQRWKQAYNALPTNFEGDTYLGMRMLFDAVAATGSTDPKAVAAYLPGKTFNTIKGPATLRAEDNQLISRNYFGVIDLYEGAYRPVITTTVAPAQIAPPVTCKR